MIDKHIEYKQEILKMRKEWHKLDEKDQELYARIIDQFMNNKSEEEMMLIADILTECVNEDIGTIEDLIKKVELNDIARDQPFKQQNIA